MDRDRSFAYLFGAAKIEIGVCHSSGREIFFHRWRNGAVEHIQTVSNDFAAYGAGADSHPTGAGGQKATAEFVPLLNVFYNRWKTTGPPPAQTHALSLPVVLNEQR